LISDPDIKQVAEIPIFRLDEEDEDGGKKKKKKKSTPNPNPSFTNHKSCTRSAPPLGDE